MSSQKKILVVEDDLIHLMVETVRLSRAGSYNIVTAERGDQAVMLARSLRGLALVVMDVRLPGMDGLQAVRRIREFAPELPILMVTAYGERYREQAMEAGADEFLVKDVGPGRILEAMERLLGNDDVE